MQCHHKAHLVAAFSCVISFFFFRVRHQSNIFSDNDKNFSHTNLNVLTYHNISLNSSLNASKFPCMNYKHVACDRRAWSWITDEKFGNAGANYQGRRQWIRLLGVDRYTRGQDSLRLSPRSQKRNH